MKNLLIINSKLSDIFTELKKNNNCEILTVKKNLKEILKKKKRKI